MIFYKVTTQIFDKLAGSHYLIKLFQTFLYIILLEVYMTKVYQCIELKQIDNTDWFICPYLIKSNDCSPQPSSFDDPQEEDNLPSIDPQPPVALLKSTYNNCVSPLNPQGMIEVIKTSQSKSYFIDVKQSFFCTAEEIIDLGKNPF